MALTRGTQVLAGIFAVSGTVHLVKPEVYQRIMPKWVPKQREVIIGSGITEIVLAAGLLAPRTRKVAGWGSIGLLIGVFPANVQMSVTANKVGNKPLLAGSIARLPLQAPMIKAAYAATRD